MPEDVVNEFVASIEVESSRDKQAGTDQGQVKTWDEFESDLMFGAGQEAQTCRAPNREASAILQSQVPTLLGDKLPPFQPFQFPPHLAILQLYIYKFSASRKNFFPAFPSSLKDLCAECKNLENRGFTFMSIAPESPKHER